MPILHLGVLDVPYSASRGRRSSAAAGLTTTGDVAEILERKYGILESFFRAHERDVASDLESSLAGAFESLVMGAPIRHDPFGTATSAIEKRMKDFLETQEVEKVGIPGVPTKAALRGVSHRRKRPYRKSNPRRPSFIDTGQMEASYKAWVDK